MEQNNSPKISGGKIALIVFMCALSVCVFLFKDKIANLTSNNSEYREKYLNFVKTKGFVADKEIKKGRKGSRTIYIVQFRDQDGKLYTSRLDYNSITELKDSITIYYNPDSPSDIISERSYKEIVE